MKATTKILAVLWALVLAGLWLPQISLAGYCPDSGNCCETDADCAGVDEPCLDPFGVCETTGDLCGDDLHCGGHCAIRSWLPCASNDDCDPLACTEPPRIACLVDENCTPPGTCEPNLCVADEACVQEPEATGWCTDDLSPCASDGDCPQGAYCVHSGNCTVSGGTCDAGYPSGRCSLGDFGGQPCRADAECAYCSGTHSPIRCDADSDCRECSITLTPCLTTEDCLNDVCDRGDNQGLFCFDDRDCPRGACVTQTCFDSNCVKVPICLMPHAAVGACDNTGTACQDDGDCDGATCVFSGSCTAGECSASGLPCTTDADCGLERECSLSGDPCTVDWDCGTWCDRNHAITGCSTDMDCGLKCSDSGMDCTTTMDCRTECHVNGTATGNPCPSIDYCVAQGFCDPEEETCTCELFTETEGCRAVDTCVPQDTCGPGEDCVINMGCTTAVEGRCSDNPPQICDSDDDCSGCSLPPHETCASDADCRRDECSRTGIACTTDEDCGGVCEQNTEVPCTWDAMCPDIGPCVVQTCLDDYCKGTCVPAFRCKEVETGKCSEWWTCTSQEQCDHLGATPGDWTCTGDLECCTGTCGALRPLPDPQCGESNGDCESCYPPKCPDEDGDEYGYPGGSGVCLNGPAEDCDDNNNAVNPGATEGPFGDDSCSDGLDNDCVDGADTDDPKCADPGACAASASASSSGAVSGTGTDGSVWYLLVMAGVLVVGGLANRVNGHKKQ